MRHGWPGAAALALLALGCGGDDDGTIDLDGSAGLDGGGLDGGVDDAAAMDVVFPIDGGQCPAWVLEEARISGLRMVEAAPLHTGRSARGLATLELGGCDRRAMPAVVIDAEARVARVTMRAWSPGPRLVCTEELRILTRPFVITFPSPGTWTIEDGAVAGGERLTVEVGAPPPGPCRARGAGDPCDKDCDCAPDQACLSEGSPGGTLLACGRPCEIDMDCPDGRCVTFDEGLDLVCHDALTQCDASAPCPEGYACEEGRCRPGITLGAGNRVECTCNVDCEAPMVCVLAADGSSRCELRCQTDSPSWCSGPHFCGAARDDLAGLAATDSVCVFAGE